jgi:hypothetical protein
MAVAHPADIALHLVERVVRPLARFQVESAAGLHLGRRFETAGRPELIRRAESIACRQD